MIVLKDPMDQERTMQFIVENLAAVTASQQQAEVRAARADRQIRGLQTLVRTGMKIIVKLGEGQRRLQENQRQLQEGHKQLQKELREGHKQLRAEIRALAISQKRTDAKFDRFLDSLKGGSNGSNGHKKR
jgi:hypothetical protein